jgi:hypothetical protein
MAVITVLAALLATPVTAAPSAKGDAGRYLVVARSAADLAGLRATAARQGAKVLRTMPQIKAMVVSAPPAPAAAWPPTGAPSAWPATASTG